MNFSTFLCCSMAFYRSIVKQLYQFFFVCLFWKKIDKNSSYSSSLLFFICIYKILRISISKSLQFCEHFLWESLEQVTIFPLKHNLLGWLAAFVLKYFFIFLLWYFLLLNCTVVFAQIIFHFLSHTHALCVDLFIH